MLEFSIFREFTQCTLLVTFLFAGHSAAGFQDHKSLPLAERVVEHTLNNGWRFLLLPRDGAPTIAFETYVATGSANDPEGLGGMAHQVQNLLFKGSSRLGTRNWEEESLALELVDKTYAELERAREVQNAQEVSSATIALFNARKAANQWVVREEFSRILEDAGGEPSLNAYLDGDGTRFVVSLPSNQIEKWCWLESERFRAPVFREFYVERDALLEDRRGRIETDSLGRMAMELRQTAYGDHPLGQPALGTMQSIGRLNRTAAKAFFLEHYGASNLTTSIVGSFDPARLIPRLEAYFSSVPEGPGKLHGHPPVPEQDGERRVNIASDSNPMVWIAWHVPAHSHPDFMAVDIAVRLLGYARSSRLEKRLVRENALVSELALSPAKGADRHAALATIRAVPVLGVATETVEAAIYEEIERLAADGPEEEELAGVKRVATADFIRSLRNNSAIARGMNQAEVECGDWEPFFTSDSRYAEVSGEDVSRVLRAWFTPERRIVTTLVGAAWER
ncbi:MAG: putative Zn-dependent peptidase [Planctomycetota bacterium]|jgi:predicted Zn-dependent peptidase